MIPQTGISARNIRELSCQAHGEPPSFIRSIIAGSLQAWRCPLRITILRKSIDAFGLASFVIGMAILSSTQVVPALRPGDTDMKVTSIPLSSRHIEFKVITPAGITVGLSVEDGGMSKMLSIAEGYSYALVPIARNGEASADFTVYRIIQDKNRNESVRQVDRLVADTVHIVKMTADPRLTIQLISVSPVSGRDNEKKVSVPQLAFAEEGKADCCITCTNGAQACGKAACNECGSCHDPDVKPIPPDQCPPITSTPVTAGMSSLLRPRMLIWN